MRLTDEQREALDAMIAGRNVFLTGEAGTGKSTVLREFRERCDRPCVVLAPTGVAAINAGGATIHSFFQFKPGLLTDETIEEISNPKKRALVRAAKIVVIDEISMVRSDLFAAIDYRLRELAVGANARKPFGGKQMILVGDFFQLPPVVKTETEAEWLDKALGGVYAFRTGLWRRAGFQCVFLKTVHRQMGDSRFLAVLNAIRHGDLEGKTIPDGEGGALSAAETLNRECLGARPDGRAVSLCTTNREAQTINAVARARLQEKGAKFDAVVTGKFRESDYPTEAELELAPGARVMLLCNKRSPDGDFLYVNGDMGCVTALGGDDGDEAVPWVAIRLDRTGEEVRVGCNEWKNYEYALEKDPISGRTALRQNEVGKFVQMPVRLAYAITVHKSQGLSLDRVDLRLGSGCFSHGQLYTALSRCRSLEGLAIDRAVFAEDLIVDPEVVEFYKELEEPWRAEEPTTISVPREYAAAVRAFLARLRSGEETADATGSAAEEESAAVAESAVPDPEAGPAAEERIRDCEEIRKLMVVYGGQTPTEQEEGSAIRDNGRGFNRIDAPVLTEIAQDYERRGWITARQLRAVAARIGKYHAQWEGRVGKPGAEDPGAYIQQNGG